MGHFSEIQQATETLREITIQLCNVRDVLHVRNVEIETLKQRVDALLARARAAEWALSALATEKSPMLSDDPAVAYPKAYGVEGSRRETDA